MIDILLWIGLLLFIYLILTGFYYFFGKLGLFCFNVIMMIILNVLILKKTIIFGHIISLAGITHLSTLFSLNLITEKYNAKTAIKSATLIRLMHITFIIMINFILAFQHNKFDTSNIHFKILFYNISYISVVLSGTYVTLLSHCSNIYIYDILSKKNIKSKWIKHNVSRLLTSYIAYALINVSMHAITQVYPDNNNVNLIEGSLLFTIIAMTVDTFIYYFLNSLKVKEA
ncbi:hypothetical protein CR532_00250 [Candidatus Borreliella tachyglossi]|uniref:Uncharacterized protein n=1 Tax=Candidatus Borreliella tachyglossi TaxID=1964448 RepID=A0A2S1LVY1_9SPIR|nr:VUT family protein [Candidatus Borreliella tachyglossi]AWG42452.1 hypothetical protein CR532_00250 [Candidatus Borreliella tachyglossi]